MNNSGFNSPPGAGQPDGAPRLGGFDTLMAWCAIVFGYLMIRVLPIWNKPAGAALLLLGIYAVSFVWIKKCGVRPTLRSLAFAAAGLIFLPAFIINPPGGLTALLFFVELAVYIYFIYSAPGNRIEDKISSLFWFDAVKAAFVMPFLSPSTFFNAMSAGKRGRGRKIASTFLWILLGLLAAVIPTLAVMMLLSYDESFLKIMEKIADAELGWLLGRFFSLIFGIPVAVYGYLLFISSRSRRLSGSMTGEQCQRVAEGVRVFPAALVFAAMTPVLLVYVIFFVSQWGCYMSAFTGSLPEGLIYSDYARQGFFELCAVAALNAVMLGAAGVFVRRRGGAGRVMLKIYSVVTSVFTLILIATALSKMALYIGAYGLTQKRVWASWFMLLMAAGFIFAVIGQFFKKFSFNLAILLAGGVLLAAISFSNVGGLIAGYNASAYLDGRLDGIDLSEIYIAGDSGVPALLRLSKEAGDGTVREKAGGYLEILSEEARKKYGFYEFNIPRARAARLLEREGYLEE